MTNLYQVMNHSQAIVILVLIQEVVILDRDCLIQNLMTKQFPVMIAAALMTNPTRHFLVAMEMIIVMV